MSSASGQPRLRCIRCSSRSSNGGTTSSGGQPAAEPPLCVGAVSKRRRVCDYEFGQYEPQWRTLVKLVEVLGVRLVCPHPAPP
jgi:hypothetical protein